MYATSGTKRILLALAALHLQPDELQDFARLMRELPPQRLLQLLRQVEEDAVVMEFDEDKLRRKDAIFRSSTANEVVERALFLLRSEANLKTEEIVGGLRELLEGANSLVLPRFVPKRSLSDWLYAVAKIVEPSKLLQAATVLRNRRIHDPRPWRLEKPE
jgi:hypothetical protein